MTVFNSISFKSTLHFFKRGIQLTASVALFNDKVGDFRWCEGASMLPTLNATGDLLLHRPLSSSDLKNQLSRGDLVDFVSPLNHSVLACKRIIGLPGDCILADPRDPANSTVIVPTGHLWLCGDNYSMSVDSRTYGPVPLGLVWPKFTSLSTPFEYEEVPLK
ncbi:mitochondrial inner membrane peptidase complex catalytic subunit [Phakopsora pachyrhizi]|nr:mitochondrial inner membrane peptidase complex catalytic subunit [Phakopsora pachyrhizi]